MTRLLSLFYYDWLPWVILAGGGAVVGLGTFFALGGDGNCKRCRARARARGKCICLIDCGHIDCVGDRPTIRAAWTQDELAVLRGEKELEDL